MAFFLQKSADVAKRPHSDCSMGSGRNTGVRSSQQAQQASTRLRILRFSGPLPENSKLLVGIVPNPYMTEKGRDERICRIGASI